MANTDNSAKPEPTQEAPEFVAGPPTEQLGIGKRSVDIARGNRILALVTQRGYNEKGTSRDSVSGPSPFEGEDDARKAALPLKRDLAAVAPEDKRAVVRVTPVDDNGKLYNFALFLAKKGKPRGPRAKG